MDAKGSIDRFWLALSQLLALGHPSRYGMEESVRYFAIVATLWIGFICRADDLSNDQKLVVACYRLDVETVSQLLRDGANVNATFGKGDVQSYFQEQWFGGYPMCASEWTPLQALANSERYPDPGTPFESTLDRIRWSEQNQPLVPSSEIEKRDQRRTTIFFILLSHGCLIDCSDSRGATPTYDAIARKHESLANLLLDQKPNVNTKTGVYIDGVGDKTPLHAAYWSQSITSRLIEMGADESAKNTAGNTPKDTRERAFKKEERLKEIQNLIKSP